MFVDFLKCDPSVGYFEQLSGDEFKSDLDVDVELFERLFGDGDDISMFNFERVRFAMQLSPKSNSLLLLFKLNDELLVVAVAVVVVEAA